MVKDTNLPQIIFNKLSKQKYQELRANNQLDPNQFYITPDELDEEKYNIKYSQITNCITKIPQDIKLELNNGTLTLKAGSKVYAPNGKNEDGTNKYIEIILDVDISRKDFKNNSYSALIIPRYNNGKIDLISYSNIDSAISGTTLPESYTGNFYNITTNYMNAYEAGNLIDTRAFPIGIMTLTNGICTSIDQVFNGFGFIGSTVFALPGVEGLIPNGRNTDGSLNNTKFTTTDVITYTPTTGTYNVLLVLASNKLSWNSTAEYLQNENRILNRDSNTYINNGIILGYANVISGRITSFSPKNTFQAIDRNDTEWLSGLGMPDYSAGISITNGTTIVKDGIIAFRTANIFNKERAVYINGNRLLTGAWGSNDAYITFCFPVSKNDIITFDSGSEAEFYPLKGVN